MAEFVASNRGKGKLLLINGFVYVKGKQVREKAYWKCQQNFTKHCKSRAITIDNEIIQVSREHNHASDPANVEELKRVEKIMNGATSLHFVMHNQAPVVFAGSPLETSVPSSGPSKDMGDTSVETSADCRPVILLTGFGPFPPHNVNSSQVAVEHLDEAQLEEDLGVKVVKEIIKVEYESVTNVVRQRWNDLKPKLTVHVGVSGQAETLVLEQLAHNDGYNKQDVSGLLPSKGECCSGGESVIQSGIRMELISKAINDNIALTLPCVKSIDPGRFLCDFIYYTSLCMDRSRVAFIHVPTLSKFSKEDISAAIAMAIKEMYLQVDSHDREQKCCKVNSAL